MAASMSDKSRIQKIQAYSRFVKHLRKDTIIKDPLAWNLKNHKKFDNSASSGQNSILKKGGGRTFLFQTEYLSINIDFLGKKL